MAKFIFITTKQKSIGQIVNGANNMNGYLMPKQLIRKYLMLFQQFNMLEVIIIVSVVV